MQISINKQIKAHLWMLAGPGSLLTALILFLIRASSLIGRPVWLFGLCLSTLIACFITYLSFKEILEREALLKKLTREKEEQTSSIRSTFDEAHHLYREKVKKLEETISEMEQESVKLRQGYEQVYDASQKEKTKASSLYISLEDALDALRAAHQHIYLMGEHHSSLPKDLPSMHKQLREQFDEKTLVLDQTRRRLFSLEGQLFVSKRDQIEEKIGSHEEYDLLQADFELLIGENQRLESEIDKLEILVSELVKPKPKKKNPPKKKVEQMLELQFESVKTS